MDDGREWPDEDELWERYSQSVMIVEDGGDYSSVLKRSDFGRLYRALRTNEGERQTQNQIRRLTAERDLLLSAIAPEDYAKIEAKLVAISESPDEEATNG